MRLLLLAPLDFVALDLLLLDLLAPDLVVPERFELAFFVLDLVDELDFVDEPDFDREVVDFRVVDFFAREDFERARAVAELVAEPAADHTCSRSFSTVRFALPASRRSCLSARSISR
ncbi:MAG TPA: hypothetical protein VGI87_04895 [Solirubrobacteraceae bacterium]